MDIHQANITAESAKAFSGVLKTLKAMIDEGEAELARNMMADMAKRLDVYEPKMCEVCRKWHDASNISPDFVLINVCKWCAEDMRKCAEDTRKWLDEILKAG